MKFCMFFIPIHSNVTVFLAKFNNWFICMYIWIWLYIWMYVCVRLRVWVCVCVCVCMHIYVMYVCIAILLYFLVEHLWSLERYHKPIIASNSNLYDCIMVENSSSTACCLILAFRFFVSIFRMFSLFEFHMRYQISKPGRRRELHIQGL